MLSHIYNSLIYDPLYNGLVFFIDIVPFADVGVAIILLTIIVKLVLFPLSKKAVRTQFLIRRLDPDIKAVRESNKEDKQKQARAVMDLYKKNGINPFSGILLIIIQLPIIFGLYWIFFRGGLPEIKIDILYSFIREPSIVNMLFLGLIDMSGKSLFLAFLAGATQYFQIKLSMPDIKPRTDKATFQEDFARSFQLQMRYFFPLFVFGFAYFISAAIALYWLTSNIFAIGQELVIRRQFPKKDI